MIDGLKLVNEVPDFLPCVRTASGFTKMSPAGEGARCIDGAAAIGIHQGAGAISRRPRYFPASLTGGLEGHQGLAPGQEGGLASQPETATIGDPSAISVYRAGRQADINIPNLIEEGFMFC